MLGVAALGIAGTIGLVANDAQAQLFFCNIGSSWNWTQNVSGSCKNSGTEITGWGQGGGSPPSFLVANLTSATNVPDGLVGQVHAYALTSGGIYLDNCRAVDTTADGTSTLVQHAECITASRFVVLGAALH
jgi:hypothetical protein